MENKAGISPPIKSKKRSILAGLKGNVIFRLYKTYIIDSIIIIRKDGFKALFAKRGKRFVMVIVLYYLIRDTILYILIPALVAMEIIRW